MEKLSIVLDKADSSGAISVVPISPAENILADESSVLGFNRIKNDVKGDVKNGRKLQATDLSRSSKWDERLVLGASFSSQVAESFRVLRSKILHPPDGGLVCRTIMVTSVLPQEGKSFVSANLGIALAQGVDQYSLLVDCDLRHPSLAGLFGISSNRGLADYLQNTGDIHDLIQKTSVEKLSIVASGAPPVNPAELLGSMRMQNLVTELSARYPDRFIIFDTPPFKVASETAVLSQVVDGVVLVVRHGVSGRSSIQKVVEEIGSKKIIGLIFNGYESNFVASRLLYKSDSYYGYGDDYRKKDSTV